LPAIEAGVNANAVQTITGNSKILYTDNDFLEAEACQSFTGCVTEIDGLLGQNMVISLDCTKLAALHLAISRRVIRLAISKLRSSQNSLANITAKHVQSVLELVHMQSGKEIHIPGMVVYKEYKNIVISVQKPLPRLGSYFLTLSYSTEIPEIGMTIALSKAPPNKLLPPNPKNPILHCTKTFEYDIVGGEIILRSRCAGDKIVLGGSKPFTKKLQDYFTDTKTPKHKRDMVPVLACGSDVLWVLDNKSPVNSKYVYRQLTNYKNPLWVSLWRDADD
jgi:tRNA(Ile)-lysidine synthase